MKSKGRTVIVSNRLPWMEETDRSRPSNQRRHYMGLTQVLDTILRSSGGTWIGCSHTGDKFPATRTTDNRYEQSNFSVSPIVLSTEERTDHLRFSNAVLWPLLHGMPLQRSSAQTCWSGYCKANGRFAEAIQVVADAEDFVWVHNYPLIMVASLLRAHGWRSKIGYFHHTPFPQPSILNGLPWRFELLHGLLQFDLIGFQSDEDRSNFDACLQEFLPHSASVEKDKRPSLQILDREIRVGTYPVGIDFQSLAREASNTGVLAAAQGVRDCLHGTKIVLGAGPLEATTGVRENLAAFHRLMVRNPELRSRVTMVQIAIPSNERVSDCRELELQIETLVNQINQTFGTPDWKPVHYYHRQLTEAQMIAFYRSADVALIAPLRDGISLAAKEFCACRRDERGALILSRFTGAAEELKTGALFVNPHDADDVARGVQTALRMTAAEQKARMALLRSRIRTSNIFSWSQAFLTDAALLYPSSHADATSGVPV